MIRSVEVKLGGECFKEGYLEEVACVLVVDRILSRQPRSLETDNLVIIV